MNQAFAAAIVKGRVVVVVGWIAMAAFMAVVVPNLIDSQSGALGQLIPANSRAVEAEKLSAERFAFPLASRTVIVERDPQGMSAGARRRHRPGDRGRQPQPDPARPRRGRLRDHQRVRGAAVRPRARHREPQLPALRPRVQPGAAGPRRRGLHPRAGRSAGGVRRHHRRDPRPRRSRPI